MSDAIHALGRVLKIFRFSVCAGALPVALALPPAAGRRGGLPNGGKQKKPRRHAHGAGKNYQSITQTKNSGDGEFIS
jgi:hypothetical protein